MGREPPLLYQSPSTITLRPGISKPHLRILADNKNVLDAAYLVAVAPVLAPGRANFNEEPRSSLSLRDLGPGLAWRIWTSVKGMAGIF
jgi:hypothetical protein